MQELCFPFKQNRGSTIIMGISRHNWLSTSLQRPYRPSQDRPGCWELCRGVKSQMQCTGAGFFFFPVSKTVAKPIFLLVDLYI